MIKDAKKILIINLRYIGDTLWMYPFIKNLKRNLPFAEITAMVNEGGEELLSLLPELTETIVVKRKEIKGKRGFLRFIRLISQVRARKFDTVLLMTNGDRPTIISWFSGAKRRIAFDSGNWWRRSMLTHRLQWDNRKNAHMIEYFLQLLTDMGLELSDTSIVLPPPQQCILTIRDRFNLLQEKDRPRIVIHPGARTRYRQWGAEKFSEVINALSDQCRIFLVGGPAEKELVTDILSGLKRSPDIVSTDLRLLEYAALCRESDIFLGNDSAPIHIAAAAGIGVIGLYGPTHASLCAPWTSRKTLFDISSLPCRPCNQEACVAAEEKACLKAITPEMIIRAIRKDLNMDSGA